MYVSVVYDVCWHCLLMHVGIVYWSCLKAYIHCAIELSSAVMTSHFVYDVQDRLFYFSSYAYAQAHPGTLKAWS